MTDASGTDTLGPLPVLNSPDLHKLGSPFTKQPSPFPSVVFPGSNSDSQDQIPEQGNAASQSPVLLILGTGGRLRYRNRPSRAEGASGDDPPTVSASQLALLPDFYQEKEPEAPKVLYRSKSGKGIAFTRADVEFLVRFISFRR